MLRAFNVNRNVLPTAEFGVTLMRPTYRSMIDRQIDSRVPTPSGFVVKKASNNRPKFSGSIPSSNRQHDGDVGRLDGLRPFLDVRADLSRWRSQPVCAI